jgi:hypothetical protein
MLGAAAVGLLCRPRQGAALTLERMDAEAHRLYVDHCNAKDDPYHRQLVEAAKASMPAGSSDKDIALNLAQMNCPICGCPIYQG